MSKFKEGDVVICQRDDYNFVTYQKSYEVLGVHPTDPYFEILDDDGDSVCYEDDDFVLAQEVLTTEQVIDRFCTATEEDMVNNPSHYTSHPSGIECIDVTRHMSFNLGNATKYIWRCDLKKDAIEDLKKAVFYLNDEIALRESKKQAVDFEIVT